MDITKREKEILIEILEENRKTIFLLKRIKRALALITIANYLAFMHLLFILITSGIAQKIWDFITIIY